MTLKSFVGLCAVLCILTGSTFAAEASTADLQNPFPFLVSRDAPSDVLSDASSKASNVIDVSSWLPQGVAGDSGFVRVKEGQLTTDAGPIRLWATNMSFDANFPETKEKAERVAARLARLGINCVRLHHMDSRSIWEGSPNKTILSDKRLAMLDYFIYQLKQHGIYVDINLHVSRQFGVKEGFDDPKLRPKYDKGLDNFEPRMIELQKKYAHDLLTHVNPYTKRPYTDEPAVAMVEINNENALFNSWCRRQLDSLPDPYATTFRKQWNRWLVKKYGTSEVLRKAWNAGQEKLGSEILIETNFKKKTASGKNAWHLECDEATRLDDQVLNSGPDQKPARRLDIKATGRVSWHPQLVYSSFPVKKGQAYTLSFYARSDKPVTPLVNCMMAHEPWSGLGFRSSFKTDKAWKRYAFTFIAKQDDEKARITVGNFKKGVYELSDVSLKPGGIVGLTADQRLEDDSVTIMKRSNVNATPQKQRDFIDFLYDTEQKYWQGMYRYIKDDLKTRSIVTGTQLSYSPASIQAGLDYIDAHSYWQHPSFPNRSWDMSDWFVRNRAMVNHPAGTLGGLASRRIVGMAYTVSEYNHPVPNQFAAEGFPMIAAFAAFQNWDGVFSYSYSHNTNYEPDRLPSFFDIKANPHKLVHMPACAAMFRRGDVLKAKKMIEVPITLAQEREKLYESLDVWSLTTKHFGLSDRWALRHGIGLKLVDKKEKASEATKAVDLPNESLDEVKRFVSDTGQIVWDVTRSELGVFTVSTPRAQLFTGFADGRRFNLDGFELAAIKSETGAATISAVCIDGKDLKSPGRVLIAASGIARNSGTKLEKLGKLGDDRITLGNRWGKAPLLCEGITAAVRLPVSPDRVTVYALDGDGNRLAPIPCTASSGKTLIKLSPKYHTLWYEVVIK